MTRLLVVYTILFLASDNVVSFISEQIWGKVNILSAQSMEINCAIYTATV